MPDPIKESVFLEAELDWAVVAGSLHSEHSWAGNRVAEPAHGAKETLVCPEAALSKERIDSEGAVQRMGERRKLVLMV
jgi:hypothetical protein